MSDAIWNRTVSHSGLPATQFIAKYFSEEGRQVFVISGAGFDPRSTIISSQLAAACKNDLSGLLIRESRPNPDPTHAEAAEANVDRLQQLVPKGTVLPVQIFSADNAVIGGIEIAKQISQLDLAEFTDVVVDVSALSLGISFPIVAVLRNLLGERSQKPNLHVMVVNEPLTDIEIRATAGEQVSTIHGFKGSFGLDESKGAAKLWLPLLFRKQQSLFDKIHSFVKPDETCPVLPFPATNPRLPDELIEFYGESIESRWEVDPRNLVYADERRPLDFYRTILRIDDARRRVFTEVCGSMTILTPIGSKVLAIGAMLAAIEREFPVIYIESVDYDVDLEKLGSSREIDGEIVHVWLSGEAYASISDTKGIVS